MTPDLWLKEFRAMHQAARAGKLSERDQARYAQSREQFARALVGAQGLTVDTGRTARRTFRVAQGMQVDIQFLSGPYRAMTLDISCGGFSVMLHQPPNEKEMPGFSLRMPNGALPLVGRAKVVSVQRRPGNVRASFSFVELPPAEEERLESVLFDFALARIP